MECAAGNELEIEMHDLESINMPFYHYSLHKLAFQNIMRAGDQKLILIWSGLSVINFLTQCVEGRGTRL